MKYALLALLITVNAWAAESIAEIQAKIAAQRAIADLAERLIEKHRDAELAHKPGGITRPTREKLNKMFDQLEALMQKQNTTFERNELAGQIHVVTQQLTNEIQQSNAHYPRLFNLTLESYKKERPQKLEPLKEFAAVIAAADKIAANPKISSDDIQKILKPADKKRVATKHNEARNPVTLYKLRDGRELRIVANEEDDQDGNFRLRDEGGKVHTVKRGEIKETLLLPEE